MLYKGRAAIINK